MIRSFALGATLGATLGAGLLAASLAPAAAQVSTTLASKVPAGTYAVEPYHTRIVFDVSHMGFTTWYGDFTSASGSLSFDPKAPTKSALSISFPTDSVSTTNPKLDGELKGAEWFDAAAYPTITFKSTKIVLLGHNRGAITGDLTFHGVTHPVTLVARFNGGGVNPIDKKYTIGFDATGGLSRADWGVKTYEPLIGDKVGLLLSGAFELQN
jgi:polyisoprenoid-binding protein YceI